MNHEEYNYWRKIRIKAYAAIAMLFSLYAVFLHIGHRVPWGYRMFFVGVIGIFVSLWRLEKRNLQWLADEEENCRINPRHLFRNDTGLAFHPDIKNWICFFLAFTGAGMLLLSFEGAQRFPVVFSIALLFWGSGLLMAAAILAFFFG